MSSLNSGYEEEINTGAFPVVSGGKCGAFNFQPFGKERRNLLKTT